MLQSLFLTLTFSFIFFNFGIKNKIKTFETLLIYKTNLLFVECGNRRRTWFECKHLKSILPPEIRKQEIIKKGDRTTLIGRR